MVRRPGGAVEGAGGGRRILVVGDDAELATALRDRLARAYVTVIEVRGGEELEAFRGCRPWPWMVVGAGPQVAAAFAAELRRCPALVVWRPAPPAGLPAHAIAAGRFSELARIVATALEAEVGGMRLAIGSGVDLPEGDFVANPCLEALIASHPRPLVAPAGPLRSASRALAAHGVPLRPQAAPGGGVVLAPLDQP